MTGACGATTIVGAITTTFGVRSSISRSSCSAAAGATWRSVAAGSVKQGASVKRVRARRCWRPKPTTARGSARLAQHAQLAERDLRAVRAAVRILGDAVLRVRARARERSSSRR